MDFNLAPETDDFRKRIRAFVEKKLLPLEAESSSFDEHENISEDLLATMRAEARKEGLWALAMPKERGGQGLDTVAMAACYEEMNRSIFGPVVFNAAAPDDGNMVVLNKVGTEAQKDQWLQPIIDGKVRSAIRVKSMARRFERRRQPHRFRAHGDNSALRLGVLLQRVRPCSSAKTNGLRQAPRPAEDRRWRHRIPCHEPVHLNLCRLDSMETG